MKSSSLTSTFLLAIIFLMFAHTAVYATDSNAAVVKLKDIKGHWAEKTINWAVENKMVEGYPDGTFQPNRQVSEAEFLVMFIKAYKVTPDKVEEMNHWADAYYNYAESRNYPVKGKTNLDTRNSPMYRTTVAEILSAADGVNYKGNNAIQYLLGKGYSKGTNPKQITVANFKGANKLTRAEAVQFIKNAQDFGLKALTNNPAAPTDPNNLPELPKEMTGIEAKQQKVLTAVESELKKPAYDGFKIESATEEFTVIEGLTGKTSVTLTDSKTGNNLVTIHDGADNRAIDLAVIAAKSLGVTIDKAFIQKVIDNREENYGHPTNKKYEGTSNGKKYYVMMSYAEMEVIIGVKN